MTLLIKPVKTIQHIQHIKHTQKNNGLLLFLVTDARLSAFQ
jgi:hypothetical protein